jgi:hypothetical protein
MSAHGFKAPEKHGHSLTLGGFLDRQIVNWTTNDLTNESMVVRRDLSEENMTHHSSPFEDGCIFIHGSP